ALRVAVLLRLLGRRGTGALLRAAALLLRLRRAAGRGLVLRLLVAGVGARGALRGLLLLAGVHRPGVRALGPLPLRLAGRVVRVRALRRRLVRLLLAGAVLLTRTGHRIAAAFRLLGPAGARALVGLLRGVLLAAAGRVVARVLFVVVLPVRAGVAGLLVCAFLVRGPALLLAVLLAAAVALVGLLGPWPLFATVVLLLLLFLLFDLLPQPLGGLLQILALLLLLGIVLLAGAALGSLAGLRLLAGVVLLLVLLWLLLVAALFLPLVRLLLAAALLLLGLVSSLFVLRILPSLVVLGLLLPLLVFLFVLAVLLLVVLLLLLGGLLLPLLLLGVVLGLGDLHVEGVALAAVRPGVVAVVLGLQPVFQ